MDNPPAFPLPDQYSHDGVGLAQGSPGMTLRDYFAAHALPTVADTYPEWQLREWFGRLAGVTRWEIRAKAAYAQADAMLAARTASAEE